MIRFLMTLFLAAVLCLAGVTGAQGPPRDKPKGDPARMFRIADKDRDGKLTREEFRQFIRNGPRFKDNPKAGDLIFGRLDTDGDGQLSLEEFRKIGTLGPPGKPKEKPLAEKVEEKPATAEGIAFFEKHIRPVLIAECFKCHSSEKGNKLRGGLALNTREGLRKGGDSGRAIVPGQPERSLLVKALKHSSEKLAMPPKKKLDDNIVADFERWIRLGAPDPRDGTKLAQSEIDIEKGRSFWAFQPPRKTSPPTVKNTTWPRSDIDRFLLSALEEKGLAPVGDADRRALIRRVTFDLTGLPPTSAEIEAFVKDRSQKAFEKVVDRLLDSPRFGEHWGRHWLDVARYAETSGKSVNFNYPHAWRYRDYVIASFNADKPYDRFVKEQMAGDLLPAKDGKVKAEHLVATGFLAVGSKPHNERNRLQFEMDLVDEQIETFSQAFLGLTVACARCHDHKFDPVPMRDYYAIAGILRSTQTCYGTIRVIQNNHPSSLVNLPADCGLPAALPKLSENRRQGLTTQIEETRKRRDEILKDRKNFATPKAIFTTVQLATLQSRLDSYDSEGNPKLQAMGVREKSFPRDSQLFLRGEVDKPGATVPRGVLQVMSKSPMKIGRGSGRLELAGWLTSPENPLTARVMVNRVWGWLFGRGIVATPDNFGASGQRPSHPELLDYLAVGFVEYGWSVKKLVRRIVLSRAYGLASTHDDRCHDRDPDNTLVWRMSKRRLEAEALRDAMLAVSGELDLKPPVGSEIARIGEGFGNIIARMGPVDGRSKCRTVYLPVARDHHLDALSLFDFADPSVVVGERATTTVPAQGLYLLNNPAVIRLSEAAARRLPQGDDRERISAAYLRFLSRPPTESEVKTAEEFLAEYVKVLEKDGVSSFRRRSMTWAAFCQALFASAEFLYRD